ncbi:MAG TPA: type IV toxin-antitoxin system AbiEi family antitoxin domain-containing protein [Solirubrobacteraceae bacterium]|nr:type IV toxin-antitoxin system AbiEi family antitoxin domain-containing protein [Solirubrobacteraceae bacterium]
MGRLLTDSQGKSGPPLDLVARLAAGQWGVVTRRQLIEGGVTIGAINYALAVGRLRQVHRGVYMIGGAAVCIEARWIAAVLACGPGAVLSHRDAAALWGLLVPPRRKLVDATTPRRSRNGHEGIDLHRPRSLPSASVTVVRAIPVTTVSRTLVDLADVAPDNHLRRAVDEADRLGRLDLSGLDACIAEANGRHGLPRLQRLLKGHRPTGFSRSDLERRFLSLAAAVGLPRPLVNKKVQGVEVDFHWPDRRLVV